jgi:hypothetical protein
VQGGSHSRLDRFQIEVTVAAALLKNNLQEPVYFAGNLALDRFGRFFSAATAMPLRLAASGRSAC